jgi:hypothetical protein
MAMILQFRLRRTQSEEPALAERSGAEIIIFPGVRRERPREMPKPVRRKRPKRDRLELPD